MPFAQTWWRIRQEMVFLTPDYAYGSRFRPDLKLLKAPVHLGRLPGSVGTPDYEAYLIPQGLWSQVLIKCWALATMSRA